MGMAPPPRIGTVVPCPNHGTTGVGEAGPVPAQICMPHTNGHMCDRRGDGDQSRGPPHECLIMRRECRNMRDQCGRRQRERGTAPHESGTAPAESRDPAI